MILLQSNGHGCINPSIIVPPICSCRYCVANTLLVQYHFVQIATLLKSAAKIRHNTAIVDGNREARGRRADEAFMDASPMTGSKEVEAGQPAPPAISHEESAAFETAALETVEFELALQLQDIARQGFEGALSTALDSVGGKLLFDMPIASEDCRRVAAVSLGAGEQRLLALVVLPNGSDTPRVEAAENSSNPVAGIVAAYAGVMDHLAVAA
jgi:hypothetical protein